MLEEEIDAIESEIEYLQRTSDQCNRKENAVRIIELEEELDSLKSTLNYIKK